MVDGKVVDGHFSKIAVGAIFFFGAIGLGVGAGFEIASGSFLLQCVDRRRVAVVINLDLSVGRRQFDGKFFSKDVVGVQCWTGFAVDIHKKFRIFQADGDDVVVRSMDLSRDNVLFGFRYGGRKRSTNWLDLFHR